MSSPARSIILAIAPKFTALLSLCGSTSVITKVLRSPKRRGKPMHRIMLGMSISNFLSSAIYFAGTWVIPAGTPSFYGDGTQPIFWAFGTEATCSFGGFFNQFAVANPLYNATLAWYYLLVVFYSWDDRRIKKMEWIFHTIPVGYALLTSSFAAGANLYGNVQWTCWILPDALFDDNKELTPIQSNSKMIQWIFLFAVVWICIGIISIIFVLLYKKMNILESNMKKYRFQASLAPADSTAPIRGIPKETVEDVEKDINQVQVSGESSVHESDEVVAESDTNAEERKRQKQLNTSTTDGATESCLLACALRKKKNDQKKFEENSQSRQIAVQGSLYVLAFYITWLFPTITRICEEIAGQTFFAIQLLDTVLLPLQGFMNSGIYLRPYFISYRKVNNGAGFFATLKAVVIKDAT